jgi:NAD+ diphosphatase
VYAHYWASVLNNTFFFHGNMLLLPEGMPDTTDPVPAEMAADFSNQEYLADQFEIPALDFGNNVDTADAVISVVSVNPAAPLPLHWRAVPVRHLLSLNLQVKRLLRAFHIAQWRRDSQFCGSCGAKNTDASDELARLCPVCSRREYPRIAPAVITLIENDQNEILLAHNKNFQSGIYSLIAGFNEAGESLEETVAREIWEEVHINVTDIRYICSQPWPFPHSLMTGFYARSRSGEIRLDGIEIEDAGWFNAENLPKLPSAGSLSLDLVNRWLSGKL